MRIYDDKYLSVTSIIELRKPFNDSSFKKWCEKNGLDNNLITSTSSIVGDKVSEYLNDIMHGLESLTAPPIDILETNLYHAVEDFLNYWQLVSTEEVVYCNELNYAGRYDGIIRNKDTKELVLADWKTYGAWQDKPYKRVSSKIRKVRWQLTMYAYAKTWNKDLAVVVFKNDGTWELEKVEFDREMMGWVKKHQEDILKIIKLNK